MKRKILLVEPNYKNKYPPIGLMKIATYHRLLGDKVEFFKGDLKDLVLEKLTCKCILRLNKVDKKIAWAENDAVVYEYIRKKKSARLDTILKSRPRSTKKVVECLDKFSDVYRRRKHDKFPKWDRIYVTTLFTFYWKITVKTIHYAKHLVSQDDQIFLGGVLASLLHKELETETGIKPHNGLLDKPGILDPSIAIASKIIVDDLPLDYSILDEIDYKYPTGSAYFTFMTKGCTRKCAFCSVPILEPTYKPKVETKDKFADIKNVYGDQQHLLLMDNNVLASPQFGEIIREIKEMGFHKGATFVEPNQLDIAVKNIRKKINDKAYVKRSYRILHSIVKRLRGNAREKYLAALENNELMDFKTTTKRGILIAYKEVKDIYEKHRTKAPRPRYVDFNQGTDARYVTDDLMRLMSEIPIRPLRIAFDYLGIREKYENAIRLAAKYEIKELSNYILYNFKDRPEELYKRLEINVKLNEELGIHIYSFPMKYIPLFGEEAKSRTFVGVKWNRKFIRAVQTILNVTKGIVAPGRSFFDLAFGKSVEEFKELLYMPETYIMYRHYFEETGLTNQWRSIFRSLSDQELLEVLPIIESNDFNGAETKTRSPKLLALLSHYRVKRRNSRRRIKDSVIQKLKKEFDRLIKQDQFIELTLTYDFEAASVRKKQANTQRTQKHRSFRKQIASAY